MKLVFFISCVTAIAIREKAFGKSFIHLKLVEDPAPPAPVVEDGAKAPEKDMSIHPADHYKMKYPINEKWIPGPNVTPKWVEPNPQAPATKAAEAAAKVPEVKAEPKAKEEPAAPEGKK